MAIKCTTLNQTNNIKNDQVFVISAVIKYGRSEVFIDTAGDGLRENGGAPWITQTPSTESHSDKMPHAFHCNDSLHLIIVFTLPRI